MRTESSASVHYKAVNGSSELPQIYIGQDLENTEFLLINERTQLKGINYCVDTLVRLNDERLIAYMDSSKDYNHVLLDNNLDLVCRLNNIDDYFACLAELARIENEYPEQIDPIFTILPATEQTFNIDADKRSIAIPENFAKYGVGVQGDEIAEIL